jgi:hypothetical protein
MSEYEENLREFLRKEKKVASIRVKTSVLIEALKRTFPKWKEDEKLREFVRELERDPEGLVEMRDEEGVLIK